jgi:hypothetical protein
MVNSVDDVVIRPFMGVAGEYSVIMASYAGHLRPIEVIAGDEFEAVTIALNETGWNLHGEISVDDINTIENNLEPLLCFEYIPVSP